MSASIAVCGRHLPLCADCVCMCRKGTRRVRDLWWQGLPPSVRGRVWSLAIGNELNITPGADSEERWLLSLHFLPEVVLSPGCRLSSSPSVLADVSVVHVFSHDVLGGSGDVVAIFV